MTEREKWELNEKIFRALWPEIEVEWFGYGNCEGSLEPLIILGVTTESWANQQGLEFRPCRYDKGWQPISDYLTGDGPLELIKEMHKRGWDFVIGSMLMEPYMQCQFLKSQTADYYGRADTIKEAVALAASAALDAGKENKNA